MKKIIHYFSPKEEESFFEDFKTKFLIIQSFIFFSIIIVMATYDLTRPDDNIVVRLVSYLFLFTFQVVILFVLRQKGIRFSGNIFSVGIVIALLVPMNILNNDISGMFKYISGFYSVFFVLAYGVIFGNQYTLITNVVLILLTTTRIYFFAKGQSPEYLSYYKAGYFNHSTAIVVVYIIFFFIQKYTKIAMDKGVSDFKFQKQQNVKLKATKAKLQASQIALKNQNLLLDEKVNKRTFELQKINKQLKIANATKNKFFSIIAHDLKNPFNSILGLSQILLMNHSSYDNEKREDIIESVYNSADGAYKLLENLLTWAHSQSDEITFLPEELDLRELSTETLLNLQGQVAKKKIRVVNEISEKDFAFADRNMIATVFRNLISNALKYTEKGGSLFLSSELQVDGNFIEVSVKDTGVGIPKSQIENLFQIDKGVSTVGTERETGTGLGLILFQEFINNHGGEICVESVENQGTTIIFSVPKEQRRTI